MSRFRKAIRPPRNLTDRIFTEQRKTANISLALVILSSSPGKGMHISRVDTFQTAASVCFEAIFKATPPQKVLADTLPLFVKSDAQ